MSSILGLAAGVAGSQAALALWSHAVGEATFFGVVALLAFTTAFHTEIMS